MCDNKLRIIVTSCENKTLVKNQLEMKCKKMKTCVSFITPALITIIYFNFLSTFLHHYGPHSIQAPSEYVCTVNKIEYILEIIFILKIKIN